MVFYSRGKRKPSRLKVRGAVKARGLAKKCEQGAHPRSFVPEGQRQMRMNDKITPASLCENFAKCASNADFLRPVTWSQLVAEIHPIDGRTLDKTRACAYLASPCWDRVG